jgi:hypothetical protein
MIHDPKIPLVRGFDESFWRHIPDILRYADRILKKSLTTIVSESSEAVFTWL